MPGPRPWRRTSLIALALLSVGALGSVEHQAQSPPPNAVGEAISEGGHARPDGSLHLDPAVVEAPHACLVCWLGSTGAALPAVPASLDGAASAARALPAAPAPRPAAPDASASRGPPAA